MTASDDIIRVENVVKRYKLYRDAKQFALDQLGIRKLPIRRWEPIPEFQALHGVDFRLRHGERVGLIGRNGAGKTTLLRLIAGGIMPTSGTIEVHGKIQPLMEAGIGFHPEFTGRENIEASLQYLGLVGRELRMVRDEVIEWVELGEYIDQPFNTYSAGMQSRTQFAVATAMKPDALLIDEVLGAGDGYFTAKSAARMKNLIGTGCSLVLVSHSAKTILQFCDRAVWLRDGHVHRDGPAGDVVPEYEQEQEMMAGAAAGARARAVTTLDAFTLPAPLRTAFVSESVSKAEPGFDLSGSYEEVVSSQGRTAFRLPGKPGVRIVDVRFASKPESAAGVSVGGGISADIDLAASPHEVLPLRSSLLVYSLAGERVGKATAELQHCHADGSGRISVRITMAPLILGVAHYILSVLIEDGREPLFTSSARYDLWSRCAALNFAISNESDPPKIHIPSKWLYGDATDPAEGRLSAIQ